MGITGAYHLTLVFFSTDGERSNQDGLPASLSVWKPVSPRFMGFPYGSPLQDRSMYSIYGSLLGLSNGTNVTLPSLALNPFSAGGLTSSALTSSTSLAAGYSLLASQQSQDSPPNGNLYHSALYGQRYHPYLPLSTSSTLKRPSAASSPTLSIQ